MTTENEQSLSLGVLATRLSSVLPVFCGAVADALILSTFAYLGRMIIGPSPMANGAGILVGLVAALLGLGWTRRRFRAGGTRSASRAVLYSRLCLAIFAIGVPLLLAPLEYFTSLQGDDWYTPAALLLVFGVPTGLMAVFYGGVLVVDAHWVGRLIAAGLGGALGLSLAVYSLWPLYGVGFLWFFAGGVSLFCVLTALPIAIRARASATGIVPSGWRWPPVALVVVLVMAGVVVSVFASRRVEVVEDTATGYRSRYHGGDLVFSGTEVAVDSARILGHLGPLLHPWPRRGLVLAPRSAHVLAAAAAHPYLDLDVVVESAPGWSALAGEAEQSLNQDERIRVTFGGVRSALRRGDQKYDVITIGGASSKTPTGLPYHTTEFYLAVKKRLAVGGNVLHGIELRGLAELDLRRIIGTFSAAFADVHLFAVPGRDLLGEGVGLVLYGSDYPLTLDYRELDLRCREPRISQALAAARVAGVDDILDFYLADDVTIRRWTAGTERLTDLFTRLWGERSGRGARPFESTSLLGVRASILHRMDNLPDDPAQAIERRQLGYEAFGLALAGRYERASEIVSSSSRLRRAVELHPAIRDYYLSRAHMHADDAAALFDCASALGNLGFAQESLELFQKALALRPKDLALAVNTALATADVGDVERALELLQNFDADTSEHWLLRYNLGSLRMRSGDPGGALADLQQAMAQNPRHEGILLAFADANLQLGRLHLAERAARQLVALNPFHPEAWDLLGLISQAEGDFAKARQRHRRALMLHPYRPSTHYNMGVVLQNEGRILEAAAAYRAALYIEPQDAEAQNNLGLLYAGAGLFERAVDSHRKALEMETHYPEAAYNLGLAYLGLGQSMAAAEAFGLALKLAPDLEAARERLSEMGIEAVEIETDTTGDTKTE